MIQGKNVRMYAIYFQMVQCTNVYERENANYKTNGIK